MANGNAHSAIDRIIDISTLQSVLNQPVNTFGMSGEKILYEGKTRGGDPVNIGRYVPGLPTSSRREGDFAALIRLLQDNPNFSDTLSGQGAQEFIQPEPSMMRQLLNMFIGK